ncbi:MAG: DsrE family protein [Dehalococcoidales bacterium]|nr:DsrE family protein [Dehalococcoidales bacterium]
MKLGLIVYSNDPETMSNALQFATYALKAGDQVKLFLLGKGVEAESLGKTESYAMQTFKTSEQMRSFVESGGQIFASGKCLDFREIGLPQLCTLSTMKDMYEMVRNSDKVVTF